MVTKRNELVIETSNLEEMKNKYLAKRLVRSWKEDFVDEDNGQVVSIDRHEMIYEKGTLLTSHELSEINFLLQSEDIATVHVSSQKRQGCYIKGYTKVWVATIELFKKKKSIYLYANSIDTAFKITLDYVEQKYEGYFKILGLRELDYVNLISPEMMEDDSDEDDFYKMVVGIIYENEEMIEQNYIIRATDAEKAKSSIHRYIATNATDERKGESFELTIISASTIKCNDVVDYRFSEDYLEHPED